MEINKREINKRLLNKTKKKAKFTSKEYQMLEIKMTVSPNIINLRCSLVIAINNYY